MNDLQVYRKPSSDQNHDAEPNLKRRRLNDEVNTYRDVSLNGHAHAIVGNQNHTQTQYGNVNASGDARTVVGDQHNHYYGTNASQSSQSDTKRLINSLGFVRMDARQQNIATALPKTCQWVFRHADFKSWSNEIGLEEQNKFLWIKGKPGCGKSTIIKATLKWAEKNRTKRKWLTISYFFNARAPGELEKSTIGLYRSLVHQILKLVPSFVPLFEENFSTKLLLPDIEWTITELQEFLKDIASNEDRPQFCLFIDALDEGEISDIRSLIDFLEDLIDHAEGHQPWRICLSSRHYPHITIRRGTPVVVEDQRDHDRDIELYVRKKLNWDTLSPELNELQQAVCSRSAGIFLWVVLVIPLLNDRFDKAEPINQLIKHIEGLPKDLEGLFAEILARDQEQIRDCISLFQWVLFAQKSLSATELYLGIQHSRCRSDSEMIDPLSEEPLQRYLTHHSRGLVEVTKSDPPVMQFIHETVRQFLVSNGGLAKVDPVLADDIVGWSHAKLLQACLSYFTSSYNRVRDTICPKFAPDSTLDSYPINLLVLQNDRTTLEQQLPFIRYVSDHLLFHLDVSLRYRTCPLSTWQLVVYDDQHIDRVLRCLQNIFEQFAIRRYRKDATILYIASDRNLSSLVKTCSSNNTMINFLGGRFGDALRAACYVGNLEIVQFLVENGANTGSYIKGYDGKYHPLLIAFKTRNFPLADYLINHGTLITCSTIMNILLSIETIPDPFEELLAAQIKRNRLTGTNNPTRLLCLAALRGLNRICAILVNSGANLNDKQDELIGTDEIRGMYISGPLPAAIFGGHVPTVSFLIDNGASVDILGRCCARSPSLQGLDLPLIVAIKEKRLDIIKVLLEKGANVNVITSTDSFPLSVACEAGNAEIVQLLLLHGAHIPDGCRRDLQTLQYGLENDEIWRYLYQNNIKLNASLYSAVKRDDLQTVRVLLELGVSPNRPRLPGNDPIPLSTALIDGKFEMVRLLLDAGATTTFRITFLPQFNTSETRKEWAWIVTKVIEWLQAHNLPGHAERILKLRQQTSLDTVPDKILKS